MSHTHGHAVVLNQFALMILHLSFDTCIMLRLSFPGRLDVCCDEANGYERGGKGGPITDHVNEFKAFTNHDKNDFSRFTNHDISYNW
jgi:hypothetical protein